jgi:hypothetical protein
MSYSWSVLSSVCGIVELRNGSSSQPSLSLGNELGSFVVAFLPPLDLSHDAIIALDRLLEVSLDAVRVCHS